MMIPTSMVSMWPAVANHLWQSTLFAVIAGLLTLALRKNQARTRYWLWLAASVKFLIPFSLLVSLGSHLARPRSLIQTQPGFYFAVDQLSQPFTSPAMPVISTAASPTTHLSFAPLLPAILMAVWLCGFLAVLFVWCVRWRKISLVMREALSLREGREVQALRRMEHAVGMRKPTRLLLSRASLEPGIFGIVRPVLVWPEGISARLKEAHLEAVLAHELCHIRRRDNLIAAIHMFVEAVFWFHPLVWWLGARLVEERERACDEEVLQLGNAPQVYAESILKTCEFCIETPLACVSGVTGANLKERIVAIMAGRVAIKLNLTHKLLLGGAGVIAIGMPLVFGLLNAPLKAQTAESQASLTVPEWQTAAGGKMAFEVASIRQSKPGTFTPPNFPLSSDDSYAPTGGLFTADFPLSVYIEFAYKLWLTSEQQKVMLAHLPKWISTDSFEIHARASGNPSKDQMRLMMQSLLADRFKLTIHFETQEVPVLTLTLIKPGKTGPQLRPHADGPPCDVLSPPRPASGWPTGGPDVFPRECDIYGLFMRPDHMLLAGSRNTTLKLIADFLASFPGGADRPVVDRTGLSGRYDFTIQWTPQRNGTAPPGGDVQPDSGGTTFLEALNEQLGLKLKPTKARLKVLVVDHIERPTPN